MNKSLSLKSTAYPTVGTHIISLSLSVLPVRLHCISSSIYIELCFCPVSCWLKPKWTTDMASLLRTSSFLLCTPARLHFNLFGSWILIKGCICVPIMTNDVMVWVWGSVTSCFILKVLTVLCFDHRLILLRFLRRHGKKMNHSAQVLIEQCSFPPFVCFSALFLCSPVNHPCVF